MSKERVREIMYSHLSTEGESKFNVMQVFYLILRCDVHSQKMKHVAQDVYLSLYNSFFNENEEVVSP